MKKATFLIAAALCAAMTVSAQTQLKKALPLLQKNNRSAAENQQVLNLFRTAKDPDTIFASGASLVKTPPSKIQEPALFNLILKGDDPLKQTFAAIIVTAMGSAHEELLPVLEGALESKDALLRAYAAGAYGIVNPEDKTHVQEVVLLYIYDPSFAVRSMNLLAEEPKHLFKYLKQASTSANEQTRAAAASWLGTLHSEDAAKQLNLSQEKAQYLLDKCAPVLAKRQVEQINLKHHEKSYHRHRCAFRSCFGARTVRRSRRSDIFVIQH